MSYEENIKKLEEISSLLEKENSIDNSLKLYNEATLIIKESLEKMEQTKGEVYKIKQELDKFIEQKME